MTIPQQPPQTNIEELLDCEPQEQIKRLKQAYESQEIPLSAVDYYSHLYTAYYQLNDVENTILYIREAMQSALAAKDYENVMLAMFDEILHWLDFGRVDEARAAFQRLREAELQEAAMTEDQLEQLENNMNGLIALIRNEDGEVIAQRLLDSTEPVSKLLLVRLCIDKGSFEEASNCLLSAAESGYVIRNRVLALLGQLETAKAEWQDENQKERKGKSKISLAALLAVVVILAAVVYFAVSCNGTDAGPGNIGSHTSPSQNASLNPPGEEVLWDGFHDEAGRIIRIGMTAEDVEKQFNMEAKNHIPAEGGSYGFYNGATVIYAAGKAGIITLDFNLGEELIMNWYFGEDIGIGSNNHLLTDKYGEPDNIYTPEDGEAGVTSMDAYDLGNGINLTVAYLENKIFFMEIKNMNYDFTEAFENL